MFTEADNDITIMWDLSKIHFTKIITISLLFNKIENGEQILPFLTTECF